MRLRVLPNPGTTRGLQRAPERNRRSRCRTNLIFTRPGMIPEPGSRMRWSGSPGALDLPPGWLHDIACGARSSSSRILRGASTSSSTSTAPGAPLPMQDRECLHLSLHKDKALSHQDRMARFITRHLPARPIPLRREARPLELWRGSQLRLAVLQSSFVLPQRRPLPVQCRQRWPNL